MGQLVDFFAGDPKAIGRALSDHDYEALRDSARFPLHVDFSLHLSPSDFDILTEEIRKLVGSGPESLLDSFEEQVGGDGQESSADVVASAWVRMVGAVADADVPTLVANWAKALQEEYEDPELTATPDLEQAVRGLTALCREANQRGLALVHTWSL